MKSKTYDSVDLVRWICSILVVYIHMYPVITKEPFLDALLAKGISKVAVPFFFVVSSFLLFRKMDRTGAKNKNRKVLWRFCKHIFLIYSIWAGIYIVYGVFHRHYNNAPQMPWHMYLWGFLFSGIQYHLWYLMATVYAAPVVYLLWRSGRNALLVACLVLHILQCLERPYHVAFIYDNPVMQGLRSQAGMPYDGLLLGVPLMCLGCLCLEDFRKKTKQQWLQRLLVATVVFLGECIFLLLIKKENLVMDKPLSVLPLVYYLVNWLLSVDFCLPVRWLGKLLRFSSLWIYCVHPLIKRLYDWVFAYEGGFRFLVVCVGSVASGVLYALIRLSIQKFYNKRYLIAGKKHSEE